MKLLKLEPKEHDSQKVVVQWCAVNRGKYPELKMLKATPNQGLRSYGAAKYFKDEGMSKGFPDLSLLVPKGKYHGLFIEMKRKGGRLTPEQGDWLRNLASYGYAVDICFSSDEAIRRLEWYLNLKESK